MTGNKSILYRAYSCVSAALILLLSGCALLYIPILLITPFQPLIRLAARVAARYGPLLLMLVVEAPDVTPGAGLMYAGHTPQCYDEEHVPCIETYLASLGESREGGVVAIVVVDAERVDEAWLAHALMPYADGGYRVMGALVDSTDVMARGSIDSSVIQAVDTGDIALRVMPGRAAAVFGMVDTQIGYASLLGAYAGIW